MKKILIPRSITFDSLKNAFSGYKNVSNEFINECLHFLGLLTSRQEIVRNYSDSYIQIPTTTLKKKFSSNIKSKRYYKNIIKQLYAVGIIEINNSYSTSTHQCKGYRFSEQYRSGFHYVTVERKSSDENRVDCQYHYNGLNQATVDINMVHQVESKLYYSEKLFDDLSLLKVSEKDLYVIEDRYGRIHSNLTNISKKYRGCLKMGREPLFVVDISNAFPFFFINQLLEELGKESDVIPEDACKYIEYVIAGSFIEELANKMKFTFDCEQYWEDIRNIKDEKKRRGYVEKSQFKIELFSKVFFNPFRKSHNDYSKKFNSLFPSVWRIIQQIKIVNYRYIAHQLQRLESEIMNSSLDRLHSRFPGRLFLRIHDAIVTEESNVNDVKSEMLSSCKFHVGFGPTIKEEPFNKYTEEILSRDRNSSVFCLFEKYEYSNMLRQKRRDLNKRYRGSKMGILEFENFETFHRQAFKNRNV
jgi:hypothetical protein